MASYGPKLSHLDARKNQEQQNLLYHSVLMSTPCGCCCCRSVMEASRHPYPCGPGSRIPQLPACRLSKVDRGKHVLHIFIELHRLFLLVLRSLCSFVRFNGVSFFGQLKMHFRVFVLAGCFTERKQNWQSS